MKADGTRASVRLTHADRVLFPKLGTTKLDLARYYVSIADHIVPHLRGRPLTLVRCPDGPGRGCVYLRHSKVWGPAALRRVRIQEKTKIGEYLVADDIAAVVALVQLSILEIHTWNSDADDVERPNRIVLDLDPDDAVGWDDVVEAAFDVRDRLAHVGLESWVKTTGGKGLHVVAPLVPRATWDECLSFTRTLAAQMVRDRPKRFVDSMPKDRRKNKILVDYLRNNRTNTSIAAFSTRAKESATVSVPISWKELAAGVRSDAFTIDNVPKRLAKQKRDPWVDYFRSKQKLTQATLRAVAKR